MVEMQIKLMQTNNVLVHSVDKLQGVNLALSMAQLGDSKWCLLEYLLSHFLHVCFPLLVSYSGSLPFCVGKYSWQKLWAFIALVVRELRRKRVIPRMSQDQSIGLAQVTSSSLSRGARGNIGLPVKILISDKQRTLFKYKYILGNIWGMLILNLFLSEIRTWVGILDFYLLNLATLSWLLVTKGTMDSWIMGAELVIESWAPGMEEGWLPTEILGRQKNLYPLTSSSWLCVDFVRMLISC